MRTGRVEKDIQSAVKTMADARAKIIQVAAKLVAVGGIDLPIREVPDLGQAVLLLSAAESDILELASAVRLATFGITAVSGLVLLDTGKAGGYVSAYPGVAIQNTSFPGRLEAVWGSWKRSPYLILAVDGLSTSSTLIFLHRSPRPTLQASAVHHFEDSHPLANGD